jgi:hypothetical protein
MIALPIASVIALGGLLAGFVLGAFFATAGKAALEADNVDLAARVGELRVTIENLEGLCESYQRALDTRRGVS